MLYLYGLLLLRIAPLELAMGRYIIKGALFFSTYSTSASECPFVVHRSWNVTTLLPWMCVALFAQLQYSIVDYNDPCEPYGPMQTVIPISTLLKTKITPVVILQRLWYPTQDIQIHDTTKQLVYQQLGSTDTCGFLLC